MVVVVVRLVVVGVMFVDGVVMGVVVVMGGRTVDSQAMVASP